MKKKIYASVLLIAMLTTVFPFGAFASSHREAPLIANDPLADNTDLYAFRSPDEPNKITIIANYVPGQLPQAGPNYYSFGENIRYEIHIDNNAATNGDDIVYRFTFTKKNEDPSTFFNIRLGKQNLKTSYKLERSMDGGKNFSIIVSNGIVPPPNIGPRSISDPVVGLGASSYEQLITNSIATATTGEKVFCGTSDDPFFVDLGGVFDLGDAPRTTGSQSIDGLKCLNVSTIALQIDISTLQKDRKPVSQATSILDPNYVIGVWASASRQKINILKDYKDYENNNNGGEDKGQWVQVSRLGMPLTNEVVIPIGMKDYWNTLTPYQDLARLSAFGNYFYNPELGLYMDDALFGPAVPAFTPLRIQKNSLACAFGGTGFGFGNGQNGLFGLKGNPALAGGALDDAIFGNLLLPAANSPRSVDLWPIFNTGVPNLKPYQLATGKGGNPLAAGKPFINNFLPTGGDMLRLNMAVPPTSRTDSKFSNLGLVQAAVLGLTDPAYNANASLQNIPNMDGFPNGRRLEDDVVRIELQAVSGIVLAAIGLWYDDYNCAGSPVTPDLLGVYSYTAGVTSNDAPLKTRFPYVASPWPGTHNCDCNTNSSNANRGGTITGTMATTTKQPVALGLSSSEVNLAAYPNPTDGTNTIRYSVDAPSLVKIAVFDIQGKLVKVLADKKHDTGVYSIEWNNSGLAKGTYMVTAFKNGMTKQVVKVVKN